MDLPTVQRPQIMLTICKKDVPEYLRLSPYFQYAFHDVGEDDQASEEAAIDVPADCFKVTSQVCVESDLRGLILTTRFWLIPEYIENCEHVYAFASDNKEAFASVVLEFGNDFPFLRKLSSALQECGELNAMGCAVQTGVLGYVKYLQSTGSTLDSGAWFRTFTALAAQGGHLDCLIYGVENGCKLTYQDSFAAAGNGHLDCLKYIYEHGGPVRSVDLQEALKNRHIDCACCIVNTKALNLTSYDMPRYFAIAAREGFQEVLTSLLNVGFVTTSSHAACAAAACNQLESLRLLNKHGCPITSEVLFTAVYCGNLQCVEYLHSIYCPWDPATLQVHPAARMSKARAECKNGFTTDDVVRTCMYAAEHGCPVSAQTVQLAATLGSVDFLAYLHGRGVELDSHAFQAAVESHETTCVKFFLDHGYAATTADYVTAVRCHCLKSVQCMHEHGVAWGAAVTTAAVQNEDVEILRYLLEQGCPMAEYLILNAIDKKNVLCMEAIHEHGTPLTEKVVSAACRAKALECLKYALSQGCPYTADVGTVAASKGNLACLQCLHEHGVKMDPAVVAAAIAARRYDCVAYALRHCDNEFSPDACTAAASLQSSIPLKLLREQGLQWDPLTCQTAIRHYSFECLKYAVKHGCPVKGNLCTEAVRIGRRDMLKWLHNKGFPWDASTTTVAIQTGNLECLKYALERQCPYEVSDSILERSPRCKRYMRERGNSLVLRARLRKSVF